MVIFVIALIAIIGAAGLALDTGHAMLNKTRLQNTVDAAALSAAKTLDQSGDVILARNEALAMFQTNADGDGNGEIAASFADGSLAVTVEFSSTLKPFVAGTAPAAYVRVRTNALRMGAWFSQVLGINETTTAASAVAGPSPTLDQACNVLPIMVCGDPAQNPYTNPAAESFFGYNLGQAEVLKSSTGGSSDVGPGNFQLIDLGANHGADDIREALAGGYNGCFGDGDVIRTAPGNQVGPVVQGINTRFGRYEGNMRGMEEIYPADVDTTQPVPPLDYDADTDTITYNGGPVTTTDSFYNHEDYDAAIEGVDESLLPDTVAFNRREAPVAFGDCTNTTNGAGDVPLLGFGCFFLLQEAEQSGIDSQIFGEFLYDCRAGGMPGPAPTTIPGPYVIQLYRDYGSGDS